MPPASQTYWNPMVPELAVTDLAVSLRFYAALGFSVRFTRSDPPFAYLELGRAQLMVEQLNAGSWETGPMDRPFGRGVNLSVEVPDSRRAASSVEEGGYELFEPVAERWYAVSEVLEEGQVEVLVQDPDGYLIRLIEPLGSRARAA